MMKSKEYFWDFGFKDKVRLQQAVKDIERVFVKRKITIEQKFIIMSLMGFDLTLNTNPDTIKGLRKAFK